MYLKSMSLNTKYFFEAVICRLDRSDTNYLRKNKHSVISFPFIKNSHEALLNNAF